MAFLKHLTVTKRSKFFNPHWATIYNVCRPCSIKYDDITRTETLSNDVVRVLKRIKASGWLIDSVPRAYEDSNFLAGLNSGLEKIFKKYHLEDERPLMETLETI